jgi:hypothetical protein
MPDYKKMYSKLFDAMADAITILQEAQRETEEIYIREDGKQGFHVKADVPPYGGNKQSGPPK